MTGPQASQQYDLWVDRCRAQLERGAAGSALAAWMQSEGVSAEMAAEILEAAQGGAEADADRSAAQNITPAEHTQTASTRPGASEAWAVPIAPTRTGGADPGAGAERTAPSVDPVAPSPSDRDASAPHPPDLQNELARAHENAAAAFARAFSKSPRVLRENTGAARAVPGQSNAAPADSGQPNAAAAAAEGPDSAHPAPQAAAAQPSHPSEPSLTAPAAIVPDTVDPGHTPPLSTETPIDAEAGADSWDRTHDRDAVEPAADDVVQQDGFDASSGEALAPAEEIPEAVHPGDSDDAPLPHHTKTDEPAVPGPTEFEESADGAASLGDESLAEERDPPGGRTGGLTDDLLPDNAEPTIEHIDEDARANVDDPVPGRPDLTEETSARRARRRGFGRRKSAPPDPPGRRDGTPPSSATTDTDGSTTEKPAINPNESELTRLLDDAERAADPEPHMPPRLASPQTEKELADAAKLLGISFRDEPKRRRPEVQLEVGEEEVKAARQLGINFRDDPESSGRPNSDDAMARAALELGINFRDADHPGSQQKSTLRRYWPIILILVLAATAMPIAVVMLLFMGD